LTQKMPITDLCLVFYTDSISSLTAVFLLTVILTILCPPSTYYDLPPCLGHRRSSSTLMFRIITALSPMEL
ncbi:hypothetical protein J6590_038772, partial [Homalodisca vitripennis]